MFRRSFDMGSVVVLKNTDLSISGILKALSEALNCNVFVDGLVDDVFPKPGSYRASDLLDAICKLWQCSWGIEEGNVYIIRDFTGGNQFPDISLGEIKTFAGAVSSRLTQKYNFDPAAHTLQTVEKLIGEVKAAVSPSERGKLESHSGLKIGLLSPALQDRVMSLIYANRLGGKVADWSRLNTILLDLDSADFRVTGAASGCIQGRESKEIILSLKASQDDAAVDALYQRLAKQSDTRISSYANEDRLKAPAVIRDHFVGGTALVSEPHFYKGLSKLNQWQCSVGLDNRVVLEPKKYSEQDDVLSMLPEEYRRFIAAGVNKLNALFMAPRFELMRTAERFSKEGG